MLVAYTKPGRRAFVEGTIDCKKHSLSSSSILLAGEFAKRADKPEPYIKERPSSIAPKAERLGDYRNFLGPSVCSACGKLCHAAVCCCVQVVDISY